MQEVVILAGLRTPFGRANRGALKDTRPDDLGSHAIKELVRQTQIAPGDIEDVVMGCAMPEAEQGMNVARIAAVGAGLPFEVPAMTVHRVCASGLQSMAQVADRIALGATQVALAGGIESMTMIPMTGNKPSLNPRLVDEIPDLYLSMGLTAENVARQFGVSRADQDAFAFRSHQQALRAQQEGFFAGEIAPLQARVMTDKGEMTVEVTKDEGPRPDTSLEKLATLKPAFDPAGSVTAGNSSPLTDGAAAVALASKQFAARWGRPVLGYFRAFCVVGVPPGVMGIGPVPAIQKLLRQVSMKIEQIDLFEINEAFAAQSVYCARALNIPSEKLNVNGGAIAIGHPLGASGTRLAITALRELQRRKKRYAIVSMCVGGGMGAAALLEAPHAP